MSTVRDIIAKLDLQPHPEGGWFKETWRAQAAEGERASATLIHFLLEVGQRSHWHRVDAAEIWLWHAGNALQLSTSPPAGEPGSGPEGSVVCQVTLGPDIVAGEVAQHVIQPGEWQAAEPLAGTCDYTLVSCVVSPGFEFSGFTLAPPGWRPGT